MRGIPKSIESLAGRASAKLGRMWTTVAGDVVPIREQKAWSRSRFDQARLSRAEWPNTRPWSFAGVSGVVGVAVGFVGAVFAGPFGGALGFIAGLVLLWFTSWFWFAVKAPSVALSAARSEIGRQGGEIARLSASEVQLREEIDKIRGERDDALARENAKAQAVHIGEQHQWHLPEGMSPEDVAEVFRGVQSRGRSATEQGGIRPRRVAPESDAPGPSGEG